MKFRNMLGLLLICICIMLSITGCTSKDSKNVNNTTDKEESTNKENKKLTGYIVIKDNTLHVDEVEIVWSDNTERIKELGLEEQKDYPSGYAIINSEQEDCSYELSDNVSYTFVDIDQLFVTEEEQSKPYTTTVKEEFLKHIGERNSLPLTEQQIPVYIEVQDGKVISITEDLAFTI